MTTITAIASQKGGTGKTTTAISLAAGLTHKRKRVLLIDVDSQANSSKVLLPDYQHVRKEDTVHRTILEQESLPIHPTAVRNLWIAPAHILLSNTDVVLTTAMDHREARLKRQLDQVKGDYDYIFIDCPPALGWSRPHSQERRDPRVRWPGTRRQDDPRAAPRPRPCRDAA